MADPSSQEALLRQCLVQLLCRSLPSQQVIIFEKFGSHKKCKMIVAFRYVRCTNLLGSAF